ncbi:hypothetical protein BSQ39_03560 [Loigolactobacillus backii]|uniref:hypothetical protein n=1 Tax=Loigolactobacillus backii TaxID=375175 RepID=UPI000C1C9FFF|nr:hypothetical protein [Loigolactobacillus backii]PIO82715.1 hypothetical protein BSQ39_03560 [Loigolactobacillus backii]
MTEDQFSQPVLDLLAEVRQRFTGEVKVRVSDESSGYLRHDQAQQVLNPDGSLAILVNDATDVDYTVSHELLHLLMVMQGYPQIYFNLTTNDEALDQQLMATATDLYNAVCHVVVVSEQHKHGLLTDTVKRQYLKGILDVVTPEDPKKADRLLVFRAVSLLDALVFYQGETEFFDDLFTQRYTVAYAAAKQLYQVVSAKPITSPFALRRTVVNFFRAFDQWLESAGLPVAHHDQFTTLAGVFSDRQSRLEVRQVFDVFHSELTTKGSNERAYIGLGKNDQQNTFVVTPPKNEKDSAAYFKELYALSVQELMEKINMAFTLR